MKQLFRFNIWTLLPVLPISILSEIKIILRKSFIDSLKHTVSIDSGFYTVHTHTNINTGYINSDKLIVGVYSISSVLGAFRVKNANNRKYKDIFDWNLPMKMVVVNRF